MLRRLKKYIHWIILAPLFMMGEIIMDLMQPDFMSRIVDDGVLAGNLDIVISLGIRMLIMVFLGGMCGMLCGVFANLGAQNFGNDLRKDLFAKIMNLSFSQTDEFTTGSLITRITNDVSQIQHMIMMLVRGMIRNGIMFIGGIFMLYMQSPKFAAIALCGLPFVVFFILFFLKKATPLFAIVQTKLDAVNNIMQENVMGARVVKAYVKEEAELEHFDDANEALCNINLQVQTLLAFLGPCMNIILNLCVVAVILVAGINVQNGEGITAGQVMAAFTYMAMILHSMTFMANIFQTITRAKASMDRVNAVLGCDDQAVAREILGDMKVTRGEIQFSHVSFSYPGNRDVQVLSDISFRIMPGQTLGIIGSTGSGKTTLASLIPRFYDATEGEILIDGMDVRSFDEKNLREGMGIVLQRAELYSRSIADNVRIGKKSATDEELVKACDIAQASEFINRTDDGMATMVTERGHSLSGGQKQRVSIARAVLKKAKIMIFDDATNALDLATEARVYKALEQEYPDTTKIVIAQRIASIKDADTILVLDRGRLVASGTHDELLESSDIYKEIFISQMGDKPKNDGTAGEVNA